MPNWRLMLTAILLRLNMFDAILDGPVTHGAIVGACVERMDGTVLYERNADTRLMPASNEKLLTCLFALSVLGPDWRPVTRFWREKHRLVLDAGGDPTLTWSQLREVARQLRLPRTHPMPVYVRQRFCPVYAPSWEFDDLPNRYAAPVTAWSVDRGSFEVWASKGRVEVPPPELGLRVLQLHKAGAPKVVFNLFTSDLLVSGTLPQKRTRLETLAMAHPDVVAARFFGSPRGEPATLPSGAPTLTLTGPPLRDIVADCLTHSINLYAEDLLLLTARRLKPDLSRTEPYEDATRMLKEHLITQAGLQPDELRPDDGSGLSRHNFVSCRALCKLFLWAGKRPWSHDFDRALVRGGKGTLAGRLVGSTFVGKTGTLDGAVALSGTVTTKSGERRVFSVILNHGIATSAKQRDVVDRFAQAVETFEAR
jgi:D-alanyl-D-alanine carboxypeptidase/D-alanyl-D-alanine-endopeptidase (penicillin-binding protein 4)